MVFLLHFFITETSSTSWCIKSSLTEKKKLGRIPLFQNGYHLPRLLSLEITSSCFLKWTSPFFISLTIMGVRCITRQLGVWGSCDIWGQQQLSHAAVRPRDSVAVPRGGCPGCPALIMPLLGLATSDGTSYIYPFCLSEYIPRGVWLPFLT